jgi:hypothetical protein
LQTDDAPPQRNWFAGKLISRKLIVALDRPGNEGGEVKHVKQIRTGVNVLLLPLTPRFDQQVKYAKEDVGKAEG